MRGKGGCGGGRSDYLFFGGGCRFCKILTKARSEERRLASRQRAWRRARRCAGGRQKCARERSCGIDRCNPREARAAHVTYACAASGRVSPRPRRRRRDCRRCTWQAPTDARVVGWAKGDGGGVRTSSATAWPVSARSRTSATAPPTPDPRPSAPSPAQAARSRHWTLVASARRQGGPRCGGVRCQTRENPLCAASHEAGVRWWREAGACAGYEATWE